MSALRRLFGLALMGFVVGACASDSTGEGNVATDAAAALDRLADSAGSSGATSDAAALRAAAEFIRLGGESSEVVIALDGAPVKFYALAAEVVLRSPDCPEPAAGAAPDAEWTRRCWWYGGPAFRTLVAWDQSVSRVLRIVSSVAPRDSTPRMDPASAVPIRWGGLFAIYVDRSSGAWWAVDGKLQSELLGTDGTCDDPRMRPTREWDSCERARFRFGFNLLLAPIVWMSASPSSIRTPVLEMAPSEIRGIRLTVTPSPVTPIPLPPPDSTRPVPTDPVPPPPSDSARPGNLVSWLEAHPQPDGSVNLVLRLRNDRDTPAQLQFNDSQRYDFEVRTADSTRVWRWSDGKAFLTVLGSETLAPGETRTWTEAWQSGGRTGGYVAFGRVTATGQQLSATAPFVLP